MLILQLVLSCLARGEGDHLGRLYPLDNPAFPYYILYNGEDYSKYGMHVTSDLLAKSLYVLK